MRTTTIRLQAAAQLGAPRSAVATFAVCGCGQDLDSHRGRHCPRCGRTSYGAAVAMIPAD